MYVSTVKPCRTSVSRITGADDSVVLISSDVISITLTSARTSYVPMKLSLTIFNEDPARSETVFYILGRYTIVNVAYNSSERHSEHAQNVPAKTS